MGQFRSIFLSHSHKDKPFVRRLADDLKRRGVRVWVDEAEMLIGDSLISKIGDAIDSMDFVGAVLSEHSVMSAWVTRELEIALNHEIAGRRVKVLPLIVDRCEIPPFLAGKVYGDFRDESRYKDTVDLLMRRLSRPEISGSDANAVTGGTAAKRSPSTTTSIDSSLFDEKQPGEPYDRRPVDSSLRFKKEANAADEPRNEASAAPVQASERQAVSSDREVTVAASLEFTKILDLGVARYMGKGARIPDWLNSLVSMFAKTEAGDTQSGYHVRAFDWDGRNIYTACDCVLAFNTWQMDGRFIEHIAASDESRTTTHVRRIGAAGTLFGNGAQLFYQSTSGLVRLATSGVLVSSLSASLDGRVIAAIGREGSGSLDIMVWSRSNPYAEGFEKVKISLSRSDFFDAYSVALNVFEGAQSKANLLCVYGRCYGDRSEITKPLAIVLLKVGENGILGKTVLPGVCSLMPHPMGKIVAVLGESLTLLAVPDLKVLKSVELPLVREREARFFPPITYSACGRYLALSYSINGEVEIRSAESLEVLATFDDAEGFPQPDIAWDKSGRYLACRFVCRSKTRFNHWEAYVHIWDVKARRYAAKIPASMLGNREIGSDTGFIWAPDAAEIAVLLDEQRVQVYRVTRR